MNLNAFQKTLPTTASSILIVMAGMTALAAPPKVMPDRADAAYGPNPQQILVLYLPKETSGPFPVLGWFGSNLAAEQACSRPRPFPSEGASR